MARELFIMLAQEKGSQGRRLRRAAARIRFGVCRIWCEYGSIISGLPEHIAVRQLASQPEGIVQDEANVAFLFQKVE